MNRWVALLRGVNVNGITVRSADLAQLFRDLGFGAVRTVLASGNVRFETADGDAARAELKTRIEAGLSERFGYEAWIVLIPHDDLAGIVDAYPFAEDPEHHAYVVFASTDEARTELLDGAPADGLGAGEQVTDGGEVVYWCCPRGASTGTAFSKQAAKSRFKATTTTRNINNLRKKL